jgi:hypothetical protein
MSVEVWGSVSVASAPSQRINAPALGASAAIATPAAPSWPASVSSTVRQDGPPVVPASGTQ